MESSQIIRSYFDMSQWYEAWTKNRQHSVWWGRLKPTTPAYNSTDINTPLFVCSASSLNSFHCGKRSAISISKFDELVSKDRARQGFGVFVVIFSHFYTHPNLIPVWPVRIPQAVTWTAVRWQNRPLHQSNQIIRSYNHISSFPNTHMGRCCTVSIQMLKSVVLLYVNFCYNVWQPLFFLNYQLPCFLSCTGYYHLPITAPLVPLCKSYSVTKNVNFVQDVFANKFTSKIEIGYRSSGATQIHSVCVACFSFTSKYFVWYPLCDKANWKDSCAVFTK